MNDLYAPTLPVYVHSKTGDLALAAMVLSLHGLWQPVVRLPLGIGIDRVGRCKPFSGLDTASAMLSMMSLGQQPYLALENSPELGPRGVWKRSTLVTG